MTDTNPAASAEQRLYRRYLIAVLGGVLSLALGIGGLALWSQPPDGDLTRIGGLPERSFGWHGTKRGFLEDHFVQRTLVNLLEGAPPGDVLVFGDSFSFSYRGNITWTNTLHEQTGLSVIFVPAVLTDVVRYLESDAFKTNPPAAAIIVEAVEREAIIRALAVHDPARPCGARPASAAVDLAPDAVLNLPKQDFARRMRFDDVDEVFSWGALMVRQQILGPSDTVIVDLAPNTLFSSAATDKMLIYSHDLNHQRADAFVQDGPETVAVTAICGLRQMFDRAGDLPMRFTIAPNKLSVYERWVRTPLPATWIDAFAVAEGALGSAYVDLLGPLRAAAQDTTDVYYPNDTHWGPAGHRTAGLVLAGSLR